ncbi:B12-binding domain-containing radical SAM protein [Desulfitobacterium sp.]|uniref:B12-binding domain-containing radical SAM protein n=1 Tax=Desulfitobacterium sp. TaxID=49981 RepID=UPI002B21189D|nr:radical SAM protein [Desulfitobacterium sp.]MEA4902435.1 radical SAM protein [Desulfitobacterium sp.]
MKVIFIVPAGDVRRTKVYRAGNNLYGHTNSVTGPLILGHILKDAGHKVEVYEELYTDLDFSALKDADVYCLYTMTSNAPRAYFLADKLRRETKAGVIIGGMHATVRPEEAAEHADHVVVGEAETVIRDVVEGKLSDRIVHASCVMNLDEIPFPDYSLLKTPCDTANVMASRGCPFCCSFCTTSRMFHPYRRRSVDSVIKELRYYKTLGFKYMNFEDDNFTADRERVKEICNRMIAENLIFKETFFFGRTDLAKDEEMLSLLEQAHLNRVLVGIESLNQESLDLIKKHQSIADIENCAKALRRHKIRLIASLVLGIDTDGPEDIRRGVDFAKKINAYQLQPAIMTPFPGTAVYEQLEKEQRMVTQDWSVFDMMNVTFIPKKMSAWELQQEFLRAIRHFYTLPSSLKIAKTFGINFGLRRFGLALIIQIGVLGINLLSAFKKDTYLYKLRHLNSNQKQKRHHNWHHRNRAILGG